MHNPCSYCDKRVSPHNNSGIQPHFENFNDFAWQGMNVAGFILCGMLFDALYVSHIIAHANTDKCPPYHEQFQ